MMTVPGCYLLGSTLHSRVEKETRSPHCNGQLPEGPPSITSKPLP
jgi:hypothetical protein